MVVNTPNVQTLDLKYYHPLKESRSLGKIADFKVRTGKAEGELKTYLEPQSGASLSKGYRKHLESGKMSASK